MKKVLFVLVSVFMVSLTASGVAQGVTLQQAEDAGFTCVDVGDGMGHCLNLRSENAGAVTVLVFPNMSPGAELIATEILLDSDVYGGQPCPTEGEADWHAVSTPFGDFNACHHYVGP